MTKRLLLPLAILIIFTSVLARTDRFFFKHNKSFSVQMILSTLTERCEWKTAPVPLDNKEDFLDIFSQKFRYLTRGGQSAVFISADKNYVLKFYRFPSHLRPLGWIKHPFSYRFSKKRERIKQHNFEKLDITFQSFLLAYNELKEESGLLYVHLNPTTDLQFSVTLVDHLNNHYLVDLDRVAFVLQKKATGVFPTLHTLIKKGEKERAKRHLNSLVHLISTRCNKGIIDNDAILDQNYGFAGSEAIHVDIGRLARDTSINDQKKALNHAQTLFTTLSQWLKEESPELSNYFETRIEAMLSSKD